MSATTPIPPVDRRHTEIRHLDLPYAFDPPESKEIWMKRAKALREQILVGLGLWPPPEKCPLNAQVFDRIEHEDYTIEKVFFESLPGYFVTGNLYRPVDVEEPCSGVLNPHGHWNGGRLEDSVDGSIPARCVTLARMGCVAFAYDMIGYNDSRQLPHRNWGSDHLQLWGISMMGLQLWNSIRSIDFLVSLPDVDKRRIACTGCSGGGTQTFLLTAVEDRIMLSAPVNMISYHMQGGCQCENGPLIRIGTNNIEIAALMAPRPMLMISATGDWTVNTPELEFPAIQAVYRLFDAVDRVSHVQIDAGHNYNEDSRGAMYPWFGKWLLGIDKPEQCREQPFAREKKEDMLVFGENGLPDHAVDEATLIQQLMKRSETQFSKLTPNETKELRKFRQTANVAFRAMTGATVPDDLIVTHLGLSKGKGFVVRRLVVGNIGLGDRVPAMIYTPSSSSRGATLLVHPRGSNSLIDENRNPSSLLLGLLERGQTVMTIDTFGTGESTAPSVDDPPNFQTTYNHTVVANRVQDIITAGTCLREQTDSSTVALIGTGEAGLWCLLACGIDPHIARAVCDTNKFDTGDDQSYLDRLFIPCLRRAGDLRTAVALAAPAELLLHNTGTAFQTEWMEEVYRVADARDRLRVIRRRSPVLDICAWAVDGSSGSV
ncbi:MAG: hypothetical protein VYA69_06475 [Gemmatimonadota bacterium]|nr:hypothetical protein [Gemmatimonadota bacterium]